MALAGQLGAVRTDRGNQLGGRDLIAHLALRPGFALADIDQEQVFAVGRSFESHRAPHARRQRIAVSQQMDGAVRAIVGGYPRTRLLKRLTGDTCKSSPFERHTVLLVTSLIKSNGQFSRERQEIPEVRSHSLSCHPDGSRDAALRISPFKVLIKMFRLWRV